MNKPYSDNSPDDLPEDPLAPTPAAEGEAAPAGPADDSLAQIAALEAALKDAKDQTLRALADAENTRKRALRERDDAGKYAISAFARDLLDFTDNFRRAMGAIPAELRSDERISAVLTGIEAMEKDLLATLSKHGIQKIEPMDEPFNPNFHEVMFEAPGTGKPGGTIIQVVEPGYIIKDRLLRPARVGVAKGDDAPPAGGHSGGRIDTQA
jgi:molecular chaperone GrpE